MAASNLPKTGVAAVVEGMDKFVKDVDTVNKAVGATGKKATEAAKGVSPLTDNLSKLTAQTGPAGKSLSGLIDKIGGIPPAALAAVAGIALIIAAVVGLGAAFFELGNRGAPLQEIGVAFDHIAASVGVNSQKLLKGLQEASEGTVSNFDLIKTASQALIGTSGQLGNTLGEKLPEFLKIAKVQADATGKSVNELFNSLVEGVKRGTPKLIESTGLIIDQKAAYQAYAETLGETVAQLSDTDKSMALLNATLDAGAKSIETLGSTQESNADKLDRINATITNTFDGLAIAVQPVFGQILDGVQTIINVFAGFAPYLAIIFNFVGKVIAGIVKFLVGIIPPDLPKRLFEGAAAAFGSFANAIIQVANQLIFPAVIAIARFIADFLIGFSPPPKGPLSMIDKGGENLMMAWLDGIAGVSLDPVIVVAKQVSDALGAIGKQSLVTVNARLAKLDAALLPFQNRLDIIKSQFDAIAEPAKQALDAIDRQAAALQEAVLKGDPQAAERLRQLDLQRDAIQGQVDAQQALVDRAQIQLALANAQQAPERALLNIRKAYLDALAKSQGTTPAGAGGGVPKTAAEKAGAGGVITPTGTAGGIVPPGGIGSSVLDMVGGQDAIDAAMGGLSDAFNGQINQMGKAQFDQNAFDLSTQINKIKSVDIGAKITDKFKGLSDAFDPSVAGSVANTIFQFFNGDASNPNSLAGIFAQAGDSLDSVKDTVVTQLKGSLATIFDPTLEGSAMNSVLTLVGQAVGNENLPGDVATFFSGLPQRIVTGIGDFLGILKTGVFDPVIQFLIGTDAGSISDVINQTIGFFSSLPTRIVDALRGIGASIYTALAVPVIQAINGLIGMVEQGIILLINKIADFASSINDALGEASPQFLKDTINSLRGAAGSVNFGRISTDISAFLMPAPLAGAKGGIFSKGFMTVGERGTELMYNASKMGVVPHELTNVLMSLESILAQPQPMPVMGGNSSTSNVSNSSFNFNGVQSDNDARRRYNMLRAGMR